MGTGGLFLRKLRARVAARPTGFVWVVEGKVAASGYPASKRQLAWLVDQGVDAVLTLTEKPLPAELIEDLHLRFEHIGMKDHEVPSTSDLDRGARFVSAQAEAGRKVLVHCLAGEGRTGCVLAAYLMIDRKASPQQALKMLREVKPEFVERRQERAVFDYALVLSNGPALT